MLACPSVASTNIIKANSGVSNLLFQIFITSKQTWTSSDIQAQFFGKWTRCAAPPKWWRMSTNLSSKQVHLQLNFLHSLNPTNTFGCLLNSVFQNLRENATFWKVPLGWLLNMSWLMPRDPSEHKQLLNIIPKYPSTLAKILPYFVRENGCKVSNLLKYLTTTPYLAKLASCHRPWCWREAYPS